MKRLRNLVPAGHPRRVLLSTVVALAALVANYLVHYRGGSFIFDEGDYYVAVHNGFWNNWFDADDVPVTVFFGTGLKAIRGEVDKGELSRMIRASGSTAFRRHYHPPFAFYPPVASRALFPDAEPEELLRGGNFIQIAIFISLLALVGLRFPDTFSPWMMILPASANWIASAGGFNMHIPFGLAVTAMMVLWYGYERNPERIGLRRGAIAAAAVATTSVEYSLFLLGLLGLWTLVDLWRRRSAWRGVVRSRSVDLLWFLGFLALIWPAGILKLGLIKSFALQTYIALFRLGGVESGFDTVWEMIAGKFSPSPVDLILLAAGLVALATLWRRILSSGSLFVTTTLVAAILVLQSKPNLVLPWYLMPVFALVFIYGLHRFWEERGWGASRETAVALGCSIAAFVAAQVVVDVRPYTQSRDVRDAIERADQRDRDIVTILGLAPPMSAYFPDREVTGYHGEDLDSPAFRDSIDRWGRDRILILLTEGAWHPSPEVALPFDTLMDVTLYRPAGDRDTSEIEQY